MESRGRHSRRAELNPHPAAGRARGRAVERHQRVRSRADDRRITGDQRHHLIDDGRRYDFAGVPVSYRQLDLIASFIVCGRPVQGGDRTIVPDNVKRLIRAVERKRYHNTPGLASDTPAVQVTTVPSGSGEGTDGFSDTDIARKWRLSSRQSPAMRVRRSSARSYTHGVRLK